MGGSNYSNIHCDDWSVSDTPSQKQELLKFELLSLNTDLPLTSDGDNSSVSSLNEGCESPLSSWDSEPETDIPSFINCNGMPDQGFLQSMNKLEKNQNQFVGVENTDDGLLWEMDNRSYEELLKKFLEKEEEIIKLIAQVHNSEARCDDVCEELKLKEEELNKQKELSEQEIFNLKTQIGKSENRLNNVNGELKLKEEELNKQKELAEEEIFKLKTQIEKTEIQLKVTQENMAKSELELVSERQQNKKLGDLVEMYKANETNQEQEVRKLKSEMLDSRAKFILQIDELHADIRTLSKVRRKLTSKLEDCDSRNKELENKLSQYEAEKLNQVELHATQTLLQDEIMSLRKELEQRMDDGEATKKKLDMVMAELDEANFMITDFKAEICSRDDKISNMKKYTDDIKSTLRELMVDYNDALNEVNNLKPRVGELENEVTRQNGVISDMAEKKKEAIRQVHEQYESKVKLYKTGYNQLIKKFYNR